jgi:hypothetical protein
VPSEATNAQTREEWRELGFYYDFDTASRVWRLVGSRPGLRNFARLLREYAANPRRHALSEHDHYGPYWYLKVITWHHAEVTENAITGTIPDFVRLAGLVERSLEELKPGQTVDVGVEYSPQSPCKLVLEARADGFDPATADAACW